MGPEEIDYKNVPHDAPFTTMRTDLTETEVDRTLPPQFENLVSQFAALIRQVGWRHRLSEWDIDELMQDVRIRLWKAEESKRLDAENIQRTPASYVYKTATTAALDLIRRRRAGRAEYHDQIDAFQISTGMYDAGLRGDECPEKDMQSVETFEKISHAISQLSEGRRPVVRMYLEGYSREDIAALLGWSEPKTRNLLYRGLADLREILQAMGFENGGQIEQN